MNTLFVGSNLSESQNINYEMFDSMAQISVNNDSVIDRLGEIRIFWQDTYGVKSAVW